MVVVVLVVDDVVIALKDVDVCEVVGGSDGSTGVMVVVAVVEVLVDIFIVVILDDVGVCEVVGDKGRNESRSK